MQINGGISVVRPLYLLVTAILAIVAFNIMKILTIMNFEEDIFRFAVFLVILIILLDGLVRTFRSAVGR